MTDETTLFVVNRAWALEPSYISGLAATLGRVPTPSLRTGPLPTHGRSIAVLPLYGLLMHRTHVAARFGATPLELVTTVVRQILATPAVTTLVFDIDSPGGQVAGLQELAAELRKPRQTRVVAVANDLAASGAYWIASAADELVVTPSGMVGSIGIVAAHQDFSKFDEQLGVKTTLISAGDGKTDANTFEPLTDRARAELQRTINRFYRTFVDDVSQGRRVSPVRVNREWRAKVFTAAEAMDHGLVDRIGTLDQTLARLAGQPMGRAPRASALRFLAEDEARVRLARRLAVGL